LISSALDFFLAFCYPFLLSLLPCVITPLFTCIYQAITSSYLYLSSLT
jgi:hypothetical protein